jgi:hypothetical protein
LDTGQRAAKYLKRVAVLAGAEQVGWVRFHWFMRILGSVGNLLVGFF